MDPRKRDAKNEKEKQHQALLDRAFQRVVGSQLDKLATAKKQKLADEEEELYRQKLAIDREVATKKKCKSLSAEHQELARTTGLSGHVVALMAGRGEDESEDSYNDNETRRNKRKKRKSKKSIRSDRKRKRNKKRSRDRKDVNRDSKKRRRDRIENNKKRYNSTSSGSSSDSSSSYSDSDNVRSISSDASGENIKDKEHGNTPESIDKKSTKKCSDRDRKRRKELSRRTKEKHRSKSKGI